MVTTSATSTNLGQSILTAQNAGSGVDTASLVSSLVQAQFAAKNAALTKQENTLTAQISSVAKVQSGITSFAAGLKSLVKGGSLVTQPTSSDASVLTASASARREARRACPPRSRSRASPRRKSRRAPCPLAAAPRRSAPVR